MQNGKEWPVARQTSGRDFERGNDLQNMEVEGGPSREPFETMPADILRGDPDMWVGGQRWNNLSELAGCGE